MIDIVLNNFTTDRARGKDFFEKVFEMAVNEVGLDSKKVELSVNLVGEGRIKALNKKYRGRNRVTDVLSFPLNHGNPAPAPGGLRGGASTEGSESRNRDQKTILKNKPISSRQQNNDIMDLGDIFICLPVAKKYAAREGVSLDYKLAFLAVHGFLHLLGYDHEKSSSEKDEMFNLQEAILKKLNP